MLKRFTVILIALLCTFGSRAAFAQNSDWQSMDDFLGGSAAPSQTEGEILADNVKIRRKAEPAKARRVGGSPFSTAILPGDEVSIVIENVDRLSGRHTVGPDGHLDLPLIGRVSVTNMRPIGVEALLSNLYGRDYLQNPKVSVSVKPAVTTFILVDGDVNRPGKVMTADALTLREVLTEAGQLKWNAKNHSIFVYPDGGPNTTVEVVAANRLSDPDFIGPVIRPNGRVKVRNTKDVIINNPALIRTPRLRAMMRANSAGRSYF